MQREHEDNPIIFGVTADPFTPAHLEMVRPYISARRKVYIIPTVVTYHRPNYKPMLSDVERLEIIEAMLSSLGDEYRPYWQIWDKELKMKFVCNELSSELFDEVIRKRRFIHTLIDFITSENIRFPSVLIGTDEFNNFKSWHRWEDIIKLCKLIAVPGRQGESLEYSTDDFPYTVATPLPPPYNLISATKIRKCYADHPLPGAPYFQDYLKFCNGELSLQDLDWI